MSFTAFQSYPKALNPSGNRKQIVVATPEAHVATLRSWGWDGDPAGDLPVDQDAIGEPAVTVAPPVTVEPPKPTALSPARETPATRSLVVIPDDWKSASWQARRSLASQLTDDPVRNGADADAAIEAELARRAK